MRRAWLPAAAAGAVTSAPVLATGDRLAAASAAVATAYAAHAPAAWAAFDPPGFARWVSLGEDLAAVSREAALAYFAVPPERFGPGGLASAADWCALAHDVARRSRRLAGTFCERTAATVGAPDGLARLRAWVAAGLALYDHGGWRAGFLAQAYFDAAAALDVLAPAHYAIWAPAGRALAVLPEARTVFAELSPALARWTEAEQALFLETTHAIAAASPRDALAFFRGVPGAVTGVEPPARALLLRALAAIGLRAAGQLADVVPVAGALVSAVPPAERDDAVARLAALADIFPAAAVAALRVLPRLYEEAPPAQVARWFSAGIALAEDNEAAGRAFFALESRTSLDRLHASPTIATLEETEGVWRKLITMLSGSPIRVQRGETFGLRPPLEVDGEAVLPARIDCLATHEDNWRIYRFLAAHVAGRRELGTYAPEVMSALQRDAPLVRELFLVADGTRIDHALARRYVGLAREGAWVATRLLAAWRHTDETDQTLVLDALFALALAPGPRPAWLPADVNELVQRALRPLARPAATAADALRVARQLAALLRTDVVPAEMSVDEMVDLELVGGAGMEIPDDAGIAAPAPDGVRAADDEFRIELAPPGEPRGGGRPLTAEELLRLLQAGVPIQQAKGDAGGEGRPITGLAGKVAPEVLDTLRRLLRDATPAERPRGSRGTPAGGPSYLYDEWDHVIGDYRTRWCRLHEVRLRGDGGEYFGQTLADYATLVPQIRRHLQRVRPEMYRPVRGLEDGEDFDLNAVTEARVEARARRTPSTKLYRARVREARDVATLFLLDMSASTDEPLAGPPARTPARRIIDAIKEALVVLSAALEELGDAYAIYGFSGQGRDNVEFYPVKGFAESLSTSVKGRIGGIEPRRSTRMGTALRHAVRKLDGVAARSKHLLLLSDGFPQDHDYGEDRRSHVYGLRDTAVALREADTAGITPFCITVDRAGHDYLREMCDATRYLVIEDVGALPRELPKIYRQVVRA